MCHELCTNHSKKLTWIHSYPHVRHHGSRVGSAGKHREENAPSNGITHQQLQHNLVNRIEATSASRRFGQPLVSAMAKTLHPNVSGQERRVQSVSFDGKIANLPFERMVPRNLGENIPRWRNLCPNVSGQERRVQSVSFEGKIANLPFERMVPQNLGEDRPKCWGITSQIYPQEQYLMAGCFLREKTHQIYPH